MADVFSTAGADSERLLEVLESGDTRHVDLTLFSLDGPRTITVDAAELGRALMLASPAFAKGLGEIAQRAILSVLNREADDE